MDRTCLVTGASSGIGFATARVLAARGVRLVMLCRDRERGTRARAQIERATGNDRLELVIADVASQADLRRVADDLRRKISRLDVLVNNAGAIFSFRALSPEAIEMHLATNYLSGFVLTRELQGLLAEAPAGRVVNLTSVLHRAGRIRFEDPHFDRRYYVVWAYAQSKLAIVASTLEWAERLRSTRVAVHCIDPGLTRTRIGDGAADPLERWAWRASAAFGQSAPIAGRDVAALALSETRQAQSGAYFVRRRIANPSRRSRDATTRARLWELSEAWTTPR